MYVYIKLTVYIDYDLYALFFRNFFIFRLSCAKTYWKCVYFVCLLIGFFILNFLF